MKWRIIMFITIGIIISIGLMINFTDQRSKPATIKVDSQKIHSQSAKIYPNYGIVPMFKVLTSLGISVEWVDDNNAVVSCNNTILLLSVSNMELLDQGGRNLFDNPPGNQYYICRYEAEEIILDDCTLHEVLSYLGVKTEINLNYAKREIEIKKTD